MTLLVSAFMVGALHALAPDHWFPFVMIAKAQKWSPRQHAAAVFLGGLAHVLSAFLIGLGGIFFLRISLNQMTQWENTRAGVFSFLLIGFGLAYLVWAVKRWNTTRLEVDDKTRSASRGFLLLLLVFGPCEPLIPFMFLGVPHGWTELAALLLVFSFATIGTMLITTQCVARGLSLWKAPSLERFSHVFAGSAIILTGIVVHVLGL